ncbi:OmpA/MotB family protein [Mobilicoccus caccae]|uniref:Flagellar basal body stator protein MotB n=1 Tax=Mobilicoccus caccae TaxID=1859295 RepID=A0ABQ6ISX8_9MICO|nr:flagellar motor protein MotB [Mobilicoccus caccae]GMA41049.1 flagellar basal body stator protein MotB [Mobilicoccus caccae]
MARKKKQEEHEEHANHERWMLSYADILTLLLALFIVMFAISKVDQKKFEEFARGTAEGFGNVAVTGMTGNFEGGDGIMKDQKPAQSEDVPSTVPDDKNSALAQQAIQKEKARQAAAAAEKKNLEEIKAKIALELKKQGLSDAVQMSVDARGLVVNIVTDKVLFDTGQADLKPAGTKVLDAIAPALTPLPNHVSVEGHTDNVPISGTYRSNWFLSTARASMVTERLIQDGITPGRIAPAGFADTRPLESNGTDDGRARNRRVAVVVLPYLPAAEAESGLAAADSTGTSGDVAPKAPAIAPTAPTVVPAIATPKP